MSRSGQCPTDAHERALSAALKACAAWDVPMQPEVLPKIIEVYLREMGDAQFGRHSELLGEARKALADLIDDLEIRSTKGVVNCSHGVYCTAKSLLAKLEAQP